MSGGPQDSDKSGKPRLARTAKGKRPQYFEDPAVDKLLSMLMSLISEVSVMKDRMDAQERLIESHGLFPQEAIEDFDVTPEIRALRDKQRAEYLERIFRVVQTELEQVTLSREMRPLEEIISDFESEEV
jgi:hypothetical protein